MPWVSHCDREAGVVYFKVMCVHGGSRGGAGQAAANGQTEAL